MKLRLQLCTLADLEQLAHVSRKTFVDAFEKDNNPEDFKTYVDEAFSDETLRSQIQNTNSQFYFVRNEAETVGYLKLNNCGAQTDINEPDSLELERIYVLQQHQGKGIGDWMLHQVVKIAEQSQLTYVWLGVWEENKAAIRFYQKNGFQKFGTHPYFVGKDKQTDWLMRLDL